ncbi:MAG TPA: glycosyltransferase family 1 protein [Methylomirabilota bacterium]|jgi:glycosyltransferase involved in cell wall biosynthesis|nr:glycosyltransferase family 1 protein [Methylomirabilota bacterium]
MRIAIDARLWAEPRSGIGRYTRALTEHLLPLAPEERWILYVDRPPGPPLAGVEVRCLPWPQRLIWSLWHAPRDLRRRPVDVFHGVTGFELPGRGPWALVTTVHDLVPFRRPDLVPPRHRWAVRCLLGGALRRARRVIAVSETTRQELLARYRLPPARVVVVPEAAAPHFAPPAPPALEAARARYRLGRPYVLFVGVLEPKKNLGVLLEAVARLRRTAAWGETELVVVGAPGWGPDPAARAHVLGLDGAVRFVGPAPDADLPALYGGALAFAFPSLWEGFGLPALEAMAAGTPVVASNRGALPEVTGGAALLVDPAPRAFAEALERLLTEPALRERLRLAGRARAAEFSWTRTARETLAVYRAAAV